MKNRWVPSRGNSRSVETMGTGWHQGLWGYKHVTNGQLMVIKGKEPCEKAKDSFKDNKENNEHVSNMLNVLYTVMWKCKPLRQQQGIKHITKCIKLLQGDPKVRRKETCTSMFRFSPKRTMMLTTGCNHSPSPWTKAWAQKYSGSMTVMPNKSGNLRLFVYTNLNCIKFEP